MKAVSPTQNREYIAKCDRSLPKEEQTVFLLNELNAEEDAYLDDRLVSMEGANQRANIGTQALDALHLGLAGVRNLPDASGKQVQLERDEDRPPIVGDKRPWKISSLDRIPKEVRNEVAGAIIRGRKLEEAETKNS